MSVVRPFSRPFVQWLTGSPRVVSKSPAIRWGMLARREADPWCGLVSQLAINVSSPSFVGWAFEPC
jgi:hypothetical protein